VTVAPAGEVSRTIEAVRRIAGLARIVGVATERRATVGRKSSLAEGG